MIFEGEADEQCACLSNVLRQQMKNKLLDIVKHPASFFNGIDNGSKVIIRQEEPLEAAALDLIDHFGDRPVAHDAAGDANGGTE